MCGPKPYTILNCRFSRITGIRRIRFNFYYIIEVYVVGIETVESRELYVSKSLRDCVEHR